MSCARCMTARVMEYISVVSPDERVLANAQEWGAHALREEMPGHNAALHAAALQEQVAGTDALLTIAADLPMLHVEDIHTLVELSHQYSAVLAASREGTGTNAILVRPPLALPYLFGPNSLATLCPGSAATAPEQHYVITVSVSPSTSIP